MTKSAIVDILCIIVEYNPSMVREYLLKEANTTEEVYIDIFFILYTIIIK